MNAGAEVGVVKHDNEMGTVFNIERYENELSLHEIECDERTRAGCAACEMFGRNLACPPFNIELQEYATNTSIVRVICYRVPIEHLRSATIAESYHAAFQKVRDHLLGELIKYRTLGKIVAGCGPCRSCKHCVIEQGNDVCSYPLRKMHSLESLGVNVVALSKKAFNISLEWSGQDSVAAYVSAIGAVFE